MDAGDRFGEWTLLQRLGEGAFGTTWCAQDGDGRQAALKMLSEPPGDELRALAKVCHPAVVAVYGGGGFPSPHLIMELARGRTLSEWITAGEIEEQSAIELTAQLADALASVHQAGVVHRDVKPENVLVNSLQGPSMRLVDFGLAGVSGGGTLMYAAPEVISGEPGGEPADVYGLGLVLWEMLHRELPWPTIGLDEAILRRQEETPKPTMGAAWLRALVTEMLAVSPQQRPRAEVVADTLVAHGAAVPTVDADLIRRRASTVHVAQVPVTAALSRWFHQGGTVVFHGAAGSGRSHVLHQVKNELRARGVSWLSLVPSDRPWGSISWALMDPSLDGPTASLPPDADPDQKAMAAAAALEDRATGALFVVADDFEDLDEGTRATVKALATRGRAHLCIAAKEPVEWAPVSCGLEPLDRVDVGVLVAGLLGTDQGLSTLIDRSVTFSNGNPGLVVDLVVCAVRDGALMRRAQSWVVDEDVLEKVIDSGQIVASLEDSLSAEDIAVGAAVATSEQPVSLSVLREITELNTGQLEGALQDLISLGLVRLGEGQAFCSSGAARATLLGAAGDLTDTHRHWLEILRRQVARPDGRMGWHIVGAGDATLARELGPATIREAQQVDVADAARLADALHALAADKNVALTRLDALIEAGRGDEALAAGGALLRSSPDSSALVKTLLALARLHIKFTEDHEAALSALQQASVARGNALPTMEELYTEANVYFRTAQYQEAIHAASMVRDVPLPENPEEEGNWLRLFGMWAQASHRQNDVETALEILSLIPPDVGKGTRDRALIEGMRGRLLYHAGRLHDASRAMALASQSEGLSAIDRAGHLNNAAIANYQTGDLSGAISHWEQALVWFERMNATERAADTLINVCIGYRDAGRWERAIQAGNRAIGYCRTLGESEKEAIALGNLGDVHLARMAFDEALDCYRQAARLAKAHQMGEELVELARRRAELAVLRREQRALKWVRSAYRQATDRRMAFEVCRTSALMAVCLAREGETADLAEWIARAVGSLQEAGAARELAEVRLWISEAWLASRRPEAARREASKVLAYAEEVGHVSLVARAEAIVSRARIHTQGGDKRLELLLELAALVTRERHLPSLLTTIAGAALDLLEADRSFVLLVEEGTPRVVARRQRKGVAPGQPSMTIVERAMTGHREIIAADLEERGDLRELKSVKAMNLQSAMCVPLEDRGEALGAIYVDSRTASRQELSEASQLLRALASHAAVAVANARHLAASQEARDRAIEADKAKSQFLANMSHELRTPLNAILGYSQILHEEAEVLEPTDLRTDLRKIRVSATRLLHTVENILLLTELEAGRIQLRPAVVDIVDIIEEVASEVRDMAGENNNTFEMTWDPNVGVIESDRRMVRYGLLTVLSNACRFTHEGEVKLHAKRVLVERVPMVEFVISDTGIGISEQDIERIFQPFTQVDGSFTRRFEGSGVSLSVSNQFCRMLGGEIVVNSEVQQGTTFHVRFPTTILTGDPARQ